MHSRRQYSPGSSNGVAQASAGAADMESCSVSRTALRTEPGPRADPSGETASCGHSSTGCGSFSFLSTAQAEESAARELLATESGRN